MLYVLSDAKRIVTTNVNSATVTILEKTEGTAGRMPPGPPPGAGQGGPPRGPMPGPPGGDWNETVIAVGGGAEGFDVSPDGKEAWIANAWDGTISVIDLAKKQVVETLAANAQGANRLKFTPDGKHVLLTPGSALVVFDAATRKEVKRLARCPRLGRNSDAARRSAGLRGLWAGRICCGDRSEDAGDGGAHRCEESGWAGLGGSELN